MYEIEYVEDEALPDGHAWALVRQGPRVCLFLKASAVSQEVLEQAWAGYRALEPRAIPEQRSAAQMVAQG